MPTETGVLCVGESRVSLDTVISDYKEGSTPERIIADYPTLELSDVYAVIAYYLKHTEEVEAYLRRRNEETTRLRHEIESEHPPNQERLRQIKNMAAKFGVHARQSKPDKQVRERRAS